MAKSCYNPGAALKLYVNSHVIIPLIFRFPADIILAGTV